MAADDMPLGLEAARLIDRARTAGGAGLLHLTESERRAEDIVRFVAAAAPDLESVVFPPWDCLPYDSASPSREAMGRRLAVLRRLAGSAPPGLVVTSPAAFLQRVPPPEAIRSLALAAGGALNLDALRRFCREAGYIEDERVDEPGEIAFRGEVIDIFPGAFPQPFRLEISDGRITAIRCFDPVTQRTTDETETLVLDAVSELPPAEEDELRPGAEHWLPEAYPGLATLHDYLPRAVLTETTAAAGARDATLAGIAEAYRDRRRGNGGADDTARRALPPGRLYLTDTAWQAERLAAPGSKPAPVFAAAARPRSAFARFLREGRESGRRVVLAAGNRSDLDRLTRRAKQATGETAIRAAGWSKVAAAPPGALVALEAPLDHGFVDPETGIALVTAGDLLGSRASGPAEGGAAAPWLLDAAELHLGDVVVHAEHGLGRLEGLEPVEDGEAIRLAYARDQALIVPAAEAGKLWRYGTEEGGVALDRLDTEGWAKRRAKVAEGLAETARRLVTEAGARSAVEAPKLVPPAGPFERFVARFPFPETPDQRRAIEAVLGDLRSGRPMNRLVVGDVGFGKTEIALRAAAAAALSGRQVAVAVPTTVLARQHYATFRRRFAELDVEVAHLSRLVSPAEARRVRAGLADGSIGIVIGTHALAAKGVAFADLALLVIDEEQRFGAEHKRKLRALAEGAHLLGMTATPIPRTLQTALVGLQELSTLATPPARRRPIRTLLAERDPATLRQALLRERRRGGQSFVVVPRIADIGPVAESLRAAVPQLALRVAHGDLPPNEVDETVVGFAEGEGDVLLATSIIESGLDVPRANTMLVLRPDRFGLAQLHQLRGRVGRGHAQAFCYLLSEPGEPLSDTTARRLGTLQALDRLGAGMAIAARDLDQRGGGELFGDKQAGHLRLIGLGLYQELLAGALRAARGEEAPAREVELTLDAAGALPADYVPEPEIRVTLYHRLARLAEPAEIDRFAEEIADRFGPPPPPVEGLLAAAGIRALARSLGVAAITAGPQAIALDFEPGRDPKADFADALARIDGEIDWKGNRLLLRSASETPEERGALTLGLLEALA